MSEVPTRLDWVAARAECSLPAIFLALAEVVQSDVESISRRVPTSTARFVFSRPTDLKLLVAKTWDAGGVPDGDGIVFELVPDRVIRVRTSRGSQDLFACQPALQPDGACKLTVDGERGAPLELWEVSRRALERLFFG